MALAPQSELFYPASPWRVCGNHGYPKNAYLPSPFYTASALSTFRLISSFFFVPNRSSGGYI